MGGISKFVSPIKEQVVQALNLKPGRLVAVVRRQGWARRKRPLAFWSKPWARRFPAIWTKAAAFCWIVDFPMYEIGDESGELEFCHNPFSMPSGGLEVFAEGEGQIDPLSITADQYDLVCNGDGAVLRRSAEPRSRSWSRPSSWCVWARTM